MQLKYWLMVIGAILAGLVLVIAEYFIQSGKLSQINQVTPDKQVDESVLGSEVETSLVPSRANEKTSLNLAATSNQEMASNSAIQILNNVNAKPTILPSLVPIPTQIVDQASLLNKLENGNFDQGSRGWEFLGEVQIGLEQVDCANALNGSFVEAEPEFKSVARLGSQGSTSVLGDISVSQQVLLDSRVTGIQFWYRIWTTEKALGFDDPILIVTLGTNLLWRVGASSALKANNFDLAEASLGCSGWKLARVPFFELGFQPQSYSLEFISGQTGDILNPSWVEIADLSLLSFPTTQANYQIWPDAIRLHSDQESEFMLTESIGSPINKFDDFSQAIDRLSQPIFAKKYLLQQPLSSLLQLGMTQKKSTRELGLFLNSDFPFSLEHEGFVTGLILADDKTVNDLKTLEPSWLRIENLWQQPLMILPFYSSEIGLL